MTVGIIIMIPYEPLELTIAEHEPQGANEAPLVEAMPDEGAAMTSRTQIN